MSEPTTAEMIAWCEKKAEAADRDSEAYTYLAVMGDYVVDGAMLRAIAARLRAGAPHDTRWMPQPGDLVTWGSGKYYYTYVRRCVDGRHFLNNGTPVDPDDPPPSEREPTMPAGCPFRCHLPVAPSAPPAVSPRAGKSEPPSSED